MPEIKKTEIRCPACAYRPVPSDLWSCLPKCGTQWHTFDTGGVCPTCAAAWPKTQCPSCGELSLHRAWYRDPLDAPPLETRETDEPVAA